jgi:SAM-dependent methyltransferase
VLDIACGTGALTIAAYGHVNPAGTIVGVDINEGMLNIARSKSSSVEWINAPAEELPFNENHFDCVVSQFGLMYFENQSGALREMMRVLKPGGSLTIAVWNKLANNPGLAAEEYLWQQLFGGEVDEVPYSLGDKEDLRILFESAGITNIQISTHGGMAKFDSIESWIHTGAKGWTEDDAISNNQLELLISTAERELAEFKTTEGGAVFPTSAHIVLAKK